MRRTLPILLAAAVGLTVVACADSGPSSSANSSIALGTAFSSVPAAFSETDNTFPASADSGRGWTPDGHEHGMRGMGFGGAMLGGGMHDLFIGRGMGMGFGGGFFGLLSLLNCSYSSANGTYTCTFTHNGVTVTRTVKLQNSAGTAQQAFDSTTNTITAQTTVAGTFTRRDSATTTVQHASTRTVSGLAKGSTQRTINGKSAGAETTTGRDTAGTFTVARTAGDTTSNVVIPVAASTGPHYPTAGTIIRAMQVTVTRTGQTPASSSRREVITYDGSATAKLVITENGTTRTCTLPLPFGRPTCQ